MFSICLKYMRMVLVLILWAISFQIPVFVSSLLHGMVTHTRNQTSMYPDQCFPGTISDVERGKKSPLNCILSIPLMSTYYCTVLSIPSLQILLWLTQLTGSTTDCLRIGSVQWPTLYTEHNTNRLSQVLCAVQGKKLPMTVSGKHKNIWFMPAISYYFSSRYVSLVGNRSETCD